MLTSLEIFLVSLCMLLHASRLLFMLQCNAKCWMLWNRFMFARRYTRPSTSCLQNTVYGIGLISMSSIQVEATDRTAAFWCFCSCLRKFSVFFLFFCDSLQDWIWRRSETHGGSSGTRKCPRGRIWHKICSHSLKIPKIWSLWDSGRIGNSGTSKWVQLES